MPLRALLPERKKETNVGYYYLIPQLPLLRYGSPPPLSTAAFMERYGPMLDAGDRSLIQRYCKLGATTTAPANTPSSFINAWCKREQALTVALAKLRAAALKRSLPDGVAGNPDADTTALAKTAFEMDNPLEAELYLDKGRWDAIEALVGTEYFSADVVFAYFLKLLLIERRSSFKVEEGFAEYKALYAGILESAPKSGATGEAK
jgi:hypothetical protein